MRIKILRLIITVAFAVVGFLFFLEKIPLPYGWSEIPIGLLGLIAAPIYYFLDTLLRKSKYKDELFYNYMLLKEKSLMKKLNQIQELSQIEENVFIDKLKQIKERNKKLYNFVIRNGGKMMTNIFSKEENNSINNKNRLKYYFNKYLKNEINTFEHSGYFGYKCKSDCSTCENKNVTIYYARYTNSFEEFKLIARELFCISPTYIDFEKDIEEMYKESIEGLK